MLPFQLICMHVSFLDFLCVLPFLLFQLLMPLLPCFGLVLALSWPCLGPAARLTGSANTEIIKYFPEYFTTACTHTVCVTAFLRHFTVDVGGFAGVFSIYMLTFSHSTEQTTMKAHSNTTNFLPFIHLRELSLFCMLIVGRDFGALCFVAAKD